MEPAIQQQPLPPPQNPAPPEPPPVPANVQQAQQQQPPSILERLRERVARELMPDPVEEMQRRARTWAAGIGSVRGGTLFEGLAAGQQAVDRQRQQEEQARTGRLQQMEQEAQREAELNLRQAEFEYNRDPTNPTNQLRLAQARQAVAEVAQGRRPTVREFLDDQGRVVLVNVETGQEIRRTGLRPTQELRLQTRPLGPADFARLRNNAEMRALQQIPTIQGVTDPPDRVRQRTELAERIFRDLVTAEESGRTIQSGGTGTGAGGAGTQTAPTTPSRVLQYSGPQPQPQQQ